MIRILLAAALAATAATTFGQTIAVNNATVGSADDIFDATGGFGSIANPENNGYFSSDLGYGDGIAPYVINLNADSSVLEMSSVTGSFTGPDYGNPPLGAARRLAASVGAQP